MRLLISIVHPKCVGSRAYNDGAVGIVDEFCHSLLDFTNLNACKTFAQGHGHSDIQPKQGGKPL